jgi:D-arabinose 5-phosphate isomerase GutQ
MMALLEQTKHLFDPQGILNPGKKVGGTEDDIKRDIITENI